MEEQDNVYGVSYNKAQEQMTLINNDIVAHCNIGFESLEELTKWAHDHMLDKVIYSTMKHQFMCISHKGEIITAMTFEQYYGNVLFYISKQGNKAVEKPWIPEGFAYYNQAYIAAEQSDGVHRPLYYRDYFIPSGYYNIERDAFNVAKPFPNFAKETGRDTSHIYKYIDHIAGECSMWLLAWLRAKLVYPTVKTQIVPIIVSHAQGSGKTTFAEVICKGLFGKDNVIVSDQYDSTARFNADYADALVVCLEEKEETDKRNTSGSLKSRATATTIRKEQKGVDPIYQESYTDFIMTTNKDVPIKFDGREDQRRFMVMEADEHFTRKESELADEVFTKLYGFDANFIKRGVPFVQDTELIEQFKHELFVRKDIAAVQLRNFPKTSAYKKCFSLPRTSEATDIESILQSIAPFIKATLEQKKLVTEIDDVKLSDIIQSVDAIQYIPAVMGKPAVVAVCRPLVFYEMSTLKPYTHSTVERCIYDSNGWLKQEYNIEVFPDMEPLLGGFSKVLGRYKKAPAARFILSEENKKEKVIPDTYKQVTVPKENVTPVASNSTQQKRLRVNSRFAYDENGCYETVNYMKQGVKDLQNKSDNVASMNLFLLESDEASFVIEKQEESYAAELKKSGETEVLASVLYKDRLKLALSEATRLYNEGKACRVVYSGAKSYHTLIHISDAPSTIDEYKWIHAYLCSTMSNKITFDTACNDPARLTRSPIKLPRVTSAYGLIVKGEQNIVLEEDASKVYSLAWRNMYEQWKNRPLRPLEKIKGKPLYPTKKEYLDAAEDIITGTFWSDSKYDGDRQRLFFPAYRLLRALGMSHDELWNKNISEGLSGYNKPEEIKYWLTRESCKLIMTIDAEIDNSEE